MEKQKVRSLNYPAPIEFAQQVRRYAADKDISISMLIRQLLEQALKEGQKEKTANGKQQ